MTDYKAMLKRKAEAYQKATEHPEDKALDHTQYRNKRNIERWRERYSRLAGRLNNA